MRLRVIALIGLICLAWRPVSGRAQSLADVARKEQERRKAAQAAGKVYTNGDLKAPPPAAVADQSATEKGAGEAKDATAAKGKDSAAGKDDKAAGGGEGKKPGDEKTVVKDQAYWRGRM